MTDLARIALVGTRRRIPAVLESVTRTLLTFNRRKTLIVTGDGAGTDLHVKRECDRLGFLYIECHARKLEGEWEGQWVGPERNEIIARLAESVIAWPSVPEGQYQDSKGTWGCVGLFRKRNKPVDVRDVAWSTP